MFDPNEHLFTPVDEEAPHRAVRLRELGLGDRPEPEFDDFAHHFMAENVAFLHRHDDAVVKVQIRAADRGGGDFDNGIARVEKLRIGNFFDPHVMFSVPDNCFHEYLRIRKVEGRRWKVEGGR